MKRLGSLRARERYKQSFTVAHKGHHCIRMLYLTFRVLYLQFACSICSSHVLFSIPSAHLQLACSICSSRVLFPFCAFFCARVFFCCSRVRQGNPRTLVSSRAFLCTWLCRSWLVWLVGNNMAAHVEGEDVEEVKSGQEAFLSYLSL